MDRQLSRRKVLTAAAGGAASFALASASASGKTEATLRWGIIGTGTRGMWTHLPVLKEAPDSQLVALCDISEQRLSAAAEKAGGNVATYSDYEKLLANSAVNCVVIATPNLLHRQMFLAALQAGKHVLCEKPAGATPADAAAMKQAADSARTVVMFGMQYRNNEKHRQIHELIASGRIGQPRYIVQNVSRGDWNTSPNVWRFADPKLGGQPMNWRFSHAATGGSLNEFSCHYFDLLNWFAGARPERVSCGGGIAVYHDGRDTWDHGTVTFDYTGGVTAVHTFCLFGPGRDELRVMGDEGSIETVPDGLRLTYRAKTTGRGNGSRSQEIQPAPPSAHSADLATLRLYQDFLQCVKTGKKPDANPERAVTASRTCWLAELASERRAEVKWDELS